MLSFIHSQVWELISNFIPHFTTDVITYTSYTYTGSVVQYWWSCTPSQSIGHFCGSARILCWMPLVGFFGFTNCVLLYDNKANTRMLVTIDIRFEQHLTLGILRSAIAHLPGCFCPWTFFQNIGFNMVPSDPLTSHLDTQLGYSTAEFQALLQLIVLAAFGVVDEPLASCMLAHFFNRLLDNNWALGLT